MKPYVRLFLLMVGVLAWPLVSYAKTDSLPTFVDPRPASFDPVGAIVIVYMMLVGFGSALIEFVRWWRRDVWPLFRPLLRFRTRIERLSIIAAVFGSSFFLAPSVAEAHNLPVCLLHGTSCDVVLLGGWLPLEALFFIVPIAFIVGAVLLIDWTFTHLKRLVFRS